MRPDATLPPTRARRSVLSRLARAALTVGAVAACSDAAPVGPSPSLSSTVVEPASGPWARVVEGETGPGSRYAVYVPQTWNGDAVFYAHGFRDAAESVELRSQDGSYALRDALGALGYAVAYSSFSENGFAVKDGAQRTHQLRGLMASELGGEPAHSYLVGHSLGAGISLDLAERFPEQYDGALLMCGMVGGSLVQTQYVGHVRALYDYFFANTPYALPGNVLGYPGIPPTQAQVVATVTAAITANPAALLAIANVAQTPLPYVPGAPMGATLGGSLAYALAWHARGLEDILERTHQQAPFDNATTQYTLRAPAVPVPPVLADQLPALLADINDRVARHAMTPAARNYLEQYFLPTGDLRIPVLSVHGMFDNGVPAFHEAALLARVQEAGATDLLLQRILPLPYGHCAGLDAGAIPQFQALVQWVESGVKPAQ